MNPDYSFNVASVRTAMQTGVDFLRNPKATWAQVQASPASVRGVLLGYALWWLLAVALVGWAVQLGLDVYRDGRPGARQVALGLGSAALAGFSALGALLGMAAAVMLMAHKNRHSKVRWPDALRLMAYGMTPVWLASMVGMVPRVGSLAMLLGVGYGLYSVWQVQGQLEWLPADKREGFMVGLAVAAMVVTVLYSVLGVLMVVAALVALMAKYSTESDESGTQPSHAPAHEEGQRETPPAQAPPITPGPGMDSAKINVLDKKITAATAQGDMAEVVRLMGERNMALQGIAVAAGKTHEL
jgi:hypothetical protein